MKQFTSHKIAVIEDDFAIASMYQLKLTNNGYDVRVAHNGQIGLEVVETFQPDLILLDIRMPIMSGDQMLEKMRATTWGSSIRVIVLTNISKDEAPMSFRFLNVDRYIVKAHHTPTQVIDIVQEVLDGKH
ncbi:MAG: hypothetical protein JWL85_970 [Candidatus Saccharibacteria bacterium]|nr:hypothetical protein [Candidatus Saccharibacteria bacterium]